MLRSDKIIYEGDTELEHYQVVDTVYDGRPARVLYSGERAAAQSGIATDGKPEPLFDYNQRFMELIIGLKPQCLLLIGGGVYTLPMAALEALEKIEIDVVELDSGLDDIAERFFGLQSNPRLHIFHGDGRDFLEVGAKQYDLIIIDAFINLQIPRSLASPEAARAMARHLKRDGVGVMNIIATYRGRNELIRQQQAAFAEAFKTVEVFAAAGNLYTQWLPQNLVLTGQKGEPYPLGEYMHRQPLPAIKF